ncbi:DUF2085 domain-containing protein [Bacteroidota bacterium]
MPEDKEFSIYDYRIAKRVYVTILMIILVWCLLIFAAPALWDLGGVFTKISFLIYQLFATTCHQLDDRSFHIFGMKFGVCSRCTSIYIGFLLSTVVYPFFHRIDNKKLPAIWYLLVAALLLLIDSSLEIFHFQNSTFFTRSATGFILGFVLPFYLIPGFVNFVQEVVAVLKSDKKNKKA